MTVPPLANRADHGGRGGAACSLRASGLEEAGGRGRTPEQCIQSLQARRSPSAVTPKA